MTECLHRRGFLGLAGVAGLGALVGAAPARASIPAAGGLEFALVTDTHVNASATQRQQWLASVLNAIAARNPAFVLHCGDITDTGVTDEYDIYGTLLPAGLRGRVHYTPGNHEIRWDGSAEELYHGHFGPAPYSFEAAGIRFIGFDPTQQLQEPGHYSDTHLDWLDRTLHGDTPSFLFQHYPLGDDFYYVDDQDRFLDLAGRHSLRGILAGHIHADHVSRFNGLTQVAFDAVRNGPMYYWGHLAAGAVELTRVDVTADGSQTTRPAATVPLTGAMGVARPAVIDLGRVSGGAVPVSVRLAGSGPAPAKVGAVAYPQPVFSSTSASTWTQLTGSGTRWQGSVDVSALAPGGQRVKVRATGVDGSWWEDIRPVELPAIAGTPRVSWQHQLDGAVQGAVAAGGNVVVAGSTGGDVAALAPDGRPLWTRKVGPVYRSAAFSTDRRTVFVPSADHRVYALDAGTGHTRWAYTAGAPVLSWPLVSTVNGTERVLVSAGNALISLDPANGRPLWTSEVGGFFAGRVACDGARVYRGGGDGHLRAVDAATGAQVWDRVLVTGDENHVLLNGPWDVALLLHSRVLLASTVGGLWGVDPATGAVRWQRSGGYMYPPAVPVETATALVLTEFGVLSLINVADGTSRWDRNLALRVLNSGGVLRDDAMWLQTVDGRLIGLDVATGADLSRLQHTTAYCFATPAVLGNLVVTGDQDGFVRAIRVA